MPPARIASRSLRSARSPCRVRIAVLVSLATATAILGGCAGNDSRAAASNSAAAREVEPAALVVAADNFVDTDGNGYRDTTSVIVYLFSRERAMSTSADGRFDFRLETPGGEHIVEWRFDQAQSAAALRRLAPGPAYIFELSLFDASRPDGRPASDRLSISEADILVTFTPAAPEGEQPRPLRGRPGAPLQVGPRSR